MKIIKLFVNWIYRNSSIILVCIAALISFTIIVYLVCKMEFGETSNSTVTFIGFVLGFISVLLSAVAIFETCKVQKQVALHDYKIKQQEAVAHLVNELNTFEFFIDFCHNGTKDVASRMFHVVNLNGVLKLSDTHNEYNGIELFCNNTFSFSPYGFCGGAYMPPTIAKVLSKFKKGYPRQRLSLNELPDSFVLIREYNFQDTREIHHISEGTYQTWESFVNSAKQLIDSINTWYQSEYRISAPNFICTEYVKEIGQYTE